MNGISDEPPEGHPLLINRGSIHPGFPSSCMLVTLVVPEVASCQKKRSSAQSSTPAHASISRSSRAISSTSSWEAQGVCSLRGGKRRTCCGLHGTLCVGSTAREQEEKTRKIGPRLAGGVPGAQRPPPQVLEPPLPGLLARGRKGEGAKNRSARKRGGMLLVHSFSGGR